MGPAHIRDCGTLLIVATRRPATSREQLAIAIDALTRRHALTAEVVLKPLAGRDTARIVEAAAPGWIPARGRRSSERRRATCCWMLASLPPLVATAEAASEPATS